MIVASSQKIMFHNPEVLHAFLNHLTEAIIVYAGYQIESGAQVIQLFDSWAHHLSPEQVFVPRTELECYLII